MDYIIAGHCFTIESKNPQAYIKEFSCGIPFSVNQANNTNKCFTVFLDTPLQDWKSNPYILENISELSVFEYDNSICEFSKYQDGYLMRLEFKDWKNPLLMLSKENNTLFMTNYSSQSQIGIEDFKFVLWIAYGLATIQTKTIAIHASTVVYQNKAVLFLGESGTGKSTHVRLWQNIIKDVFILNDDSPIIRVENDIPIVYGSVWSGKTAFYVNNRYPIAAIVRIKQASRNAIRTLTTLESLAALYPSCPPMFAYDKHLADNIIESLSIIIHKTPVFMLECLPDENSVFTSFSAIFNNK